MLHLQYFEPHAEDFQTLFRIATISHPDNPIKLGMFAPVFFMYSSDSLCVFTCSCSCASLLPSLIRSSAVNCTGSKCGSPSLQTVCQSVSLLKSHTPLLSKASDA